MGKNSCVEWECNENQRVQSNICVDCAIDETRSSGDHATGGDTLCTGSSLCGPSTGWNGTHCVINSGLICFTCDQVQNQYNIEGCC